MIGFCPLASGSKGNCLYLGTHKTKILIDAGLSGRATKNKLAQLNVDIRDIDAILVTHDHGDHIYGLKVLALQYNIPVLCNSETAKGIYGTLKQCPKFKIFSTGETFEYGGMEIHPFSIPHDTMDPVAFTLKIDDLKLGICTDLGFATALVEHHLQKCSILYLESNHDISHVLACARPQKYKDRVLGRNGHLSNEASAELLVKLVHEKLKHVYLAHLSSECNSPEKALKIVNSALAQQGLEVSLSVAPQDSLAQIMYF